MDNTLKIFSMQKRMCSLFNNNSNKYCRIRWQKCSLDQALSAKDTEIKLEFLKLFKYAHANLKNSLQEIKSIIAVYHFL